MKEINRLAERGQERIETVGLSGDAREVARNMDHYSIETGASGSAERSASDSGFAALAKDPSSKKDYVAAQKNFIEAAIPKAGEEPKMTPDEARAKYIDPVVQKHKDVYEPAYMDAYNKTYKAEIARGYEEAARNLGAPPEVAVELKSKSFEIASQVSMDKGTLASRPDVLGSLSGTPLSEFGHKEKEFDVSKQKETEAWKPNEDKIHEALGQNVLSATERYKQTQENPDKHSAREMALGSLTLFPTGAVEYDRQTGYIMVGGSSLSSANPSKDVENLLGNIGSVPKEKRDEIYFKAAFNLHQAGEEAVQLAAAAKEKPAKAPAPKEPKE